jgi:hypothetical protein
MRRRRPRRKGGGAQRNLCTGRRKSMGGPTSEAKRSFEQAPASKDSARRSGACHRPRGNLALSTSGRTPGASGTAGRGDPRKRGTQSRSAEPDVVAW